VSTKARRHRQRCC